MANVQLGGGVPGASTREFGRVIGKVAAWWPLDAQHELYRARGSRRRDRRHRATAFRRTSCSAPAATRRCAATRSKASACQQGDAVVGGRYYAVASAEVDALDRRERGASRRSSTPATRPTRCATSISALGYGVGAPAAHADRPVPPRRRVRPGSAERARALFRRAVVLSAHDARRTPSPPPPRRAAALAARARSRGAASLLLVVASRRSRSWHAGRARLWSIARAVARSEGRLTIEGAEGSLLSTVRVARIAWHGDDVDVEARRRRARRGAPIGLFSRHVDRHGLGAQAAGDHDQAVRGRHWRCRPTSRCRSRSTCATSASSASNGASARAAATITGVAFGYAGGAHDARDRAAAVRHRRRHAGGQRRDRRRRAVRDARRRSLSPATARFAIRAPTLVASGTLARIGVGRQGHVARCGARRHGDAHAVRAGALVVDARRRCARRRPRAVRRDAARDRADGRRSTRGRLPRASPARSSARNADAGAIDAGRVPLDAADVALRLERHACWRWTTSTRGFAGDARVTGQATLPADGAPSRPQACRAQSRPASRPFGADRDTARPARSPRRSRRRRSRCAPNSRSRTWRSISPPRSPAAASMSNAFAAARAAARSPAAAASRSTRARAFDVTARRRAFRSVALRRTFPPARLDGNDQRRAARWRRRGASKPTSRWRRAAGSTASRSAARCAPTRRAKSLRNVAVDVAVAFGDDRRHRRRRHARRQTRVQRRRAPNSRSCAAAGATRRRRDARRDRRRAARPRNGDERARRQRPRRRRSRRRAAMGQAAARGHARVHAPRSRPADSRWTPCRERARERSR